MPIVSTILALALIVADEPKPADTLPANLPKIAQPRTPENPQADEVWPMTLPEAIRIGLDNSEVIRVFHQGTPVILDHCFCEIPHNVAAVEPPPGFDILIAPLNRDASAWNFQAAVMAHVRSIEQQYWALSHQNVVLWSRETAVRLGEEILRRERAELEGGRATKADVAEAEQQLENFQLNLVSATSDLITTERQLRNILGLPATDNRRIVPATAPTEARVEPDWEVSVREMLESQPDIVQQRALVRLTELQLLLARNQLLPPLGLDFVREVSNLGHTLDNNGLLLFWNAVRTLGAATGPAVFRDPEFIEHQVRLSLVQVFGFGSRSPLANTRQAQYQLLRQKAFLQQIVHQSTHSLARFFLEIDANHKQYRTAQRLRDAAQQRLEAQRAFYEQGRITIDRLLDAVSQYSNAIAAESQYKTSYNTSIAALEEAKGTLLAYDHITIADGPATRKPFIQAKVQPKDDQLAPAGFEAPAPKPEPAKTPAAPMSYKIKAKIAGLKVLEVEVEVNPAPPVPPGR